jgi:hypothetical protein
VQNFKYKTDMMNKILFTCAILLVSVLSRAQQISVPWTCGFEAEETVEMSQWVLNPGTSDATDLWTIGNAGSSEGMQSLYISTDGGTTASKGTNRNIVMAYRLINLPVRAAEYFVSFDYRQPSNEGTMYVFLDYASTLISGTDNYQILQYASSSRADGIPTKVLDQARWVSTQMPSTASSRTQEMRNTPEWCNVTIDCGEGMNYSDRFTTNTSKRQLALVFVWVNRNSVDTAGIGACIDNVQIASATVAKPTNLKAYYQCADSSITIRWEGGLDGYMVGYRKSSAGSWRTYTYTGNTAATSHSYKVGGLKDGTYDFRVCGWKKYFANNKWQIDTTGYVSVSNILLYCPENQCINFAALDQADCGYGDETDLAIIHEKVDFGADDVLSFHTVNTDQNAYDIRTLNRLKIIPDNAMVSVRIGNWYSPSNNKNNPKNKLVDQNGKPQNIFGQSISYQFVVDSATAAILLLRYAMVLEYSSGHGREQMPYMKLTVYDEYGDIVGGICGQQLFYCPAASDESPDEQEQRFREEKWQIVTKEELPAKNIDLGFTGNEIYWKDWSTMGLNLSEYDGKLLRVVVEARGCSPGAHYGYGYFTLGCSDGKIKTNDNNSFEAPDGFNYRWYLKDNPDVTLATTQAFYIDSLDSRIYNVDVIFQEDTSCYFTLEASSPYEIPEPTTTPVGIPVTYTKDSTVLDSELVTLHLPIPPIFEGFTFVKWIAVSDDVMEGIEIQAVYSPDEPTSAPAVVANPSNPTQKLIREGNVYILRGDKTYTITGQLVK